MEKLGAGDPKGIGAYRLLARLGAGGMGHVYLARSDRGRTIAVKLVREELAAQEEFRARFRHEVQAARRVGGYWTAPVLDADTEAAVPWVATGYVAGPSLQQVVGHDHGALPERSVRILAAGLAHALTDIHAAGIVHRDLKPSNVLVTIDGPRVIDFGIARALETMAGDGLTSTGSLVGSPGFMAPEQVRGDRITPACDVFCLGSVLAYAATGTLPFGNADSGLHALMFRIAQEEPDLTGVPEGIADLVRECLRKDPAARPTLDRILERTGAEDTVSGGRSRDPWLPGSLVAQLGRHAVQLLEVEDPEGTLGEGRTIVAGELAGGSGAVPGAGAPMGGAGAGSGSGAAAGAGAFPVAGAGGGAEAAGRTADAGSGSDFGPGADSGTESGSGSGSGHGSAPESAADRTTVPAPGHGPVPGQALTAGQGPVPGQYPAPGQGSVPGREPAVGQVPASAPGQAPASGQGPAPIASPEHAPVSDDGGVVAPPGQPGGVHRLPTQDAGQTPPPAHPAYGYPQSHPQVPPAHAHPQQPAPPGGRPGAPQPYNPYAGGPGSAPSYGLPSAGATQPYGPAGFPPQEPPRGNGRSTALLVVIALVVALAAGGSVYALLQGGTGRDDKGSGTVTPAPTTSAPPTTSTPTSPGPSPTPTESESPSDGAVPDSYLGTWTASIDNATGHSTRELTLTQGEVGDTVLRLVADGPVDGGGTYHCVFEAKLTERPGGDGPLRIGPSTVTSGEPLSSCSPGESTEVSLLPDGGLRRERQGGGESLTYTRQ
ncbi:serine/threonine-protein kinase [Streptomyces brasiliensis]|uniref:Serine/threonine protein kinase n=1 Tax=Streptomyces brasiliensis TaxID=1954 RepID=A0A917L9G9_9ACTN|nr:serine/threonine-protein kinase [Streptomyces brasiliensis]GGJ49567.1 serine/threonine protein kinase [Streptomyces brasiliensis]